jgi:hypothetical protein
LSRDREPSDFGDVARPKIDLPAEERDRLRAAWAAYRAAAGESEKARRAFLRELRRLERRYPQAALARAIGVTRAAIHKRLRRK